MRKWLEKGNQRLTVKAAFFNTDDGVVVSAEPVWLQLAFDLLTGMFYQVGLCTNVRNTVGMVCRSFQATRVHAGEDYIQRMTG